MLLLTVIHDTILKQDPTQPASDLPPAALYPIAAGARLAVTAAGPAAANHRQITFTEPLQGFTTWYAYGGHVLLPEETLPELVAAVDRAALFQQYLTQELEAGSNQMHLSFLDRGIDQSPYKPEIPHYPDRLQQMAAARPPADPAFAPYPPVGVQPTLESSALDWLHPSIEQACVCIGCCVDGQMHARWLGRNALEQGQFWSSTKIVGLLYTLCQANTQAPAIAIDHCTIVDPTGQVASLSFMDAAIDLISYRKGSDASNSMAAMFKRFSSQPGLEQWWQSLTGNPHLEFRGGYGAEPWIADPRLQAGSTRLLDAVPAGAGGENWVTAYDLTRLLTMLTWHPQLAPTARLPGAQWHSLAAVVQAMGYGSARFFDVAIATLGLEPLIQQPVILSKLGFGASDQRDRTELIYSAYAQFLDPLPLAAGDPAALRTIALTLRGAARTPDRDLDAEARTIDARMAAEVTELLRRLVTDSLP